MGPSVFRFALSLSLALIALPALAQEAAPDALLTTATSELIAAIRQDRELRPGSPSRVAETIETRVLPLFDFAYMTRTAVARNWRLASAEQQTILIAEFKALLVRTYSSVLASYEDQVIEYKPQRAPAGVTEVTVKSEMKQSGKQPMAIDYDMQKTASGWKVHDIKIAGVSMITTYRTSFAEEVRDGGVAGLIKALTDKNRGAVAGARPQASLRRASVYVYAPIHGAAQHAG